MSNKKDKGNKPEQIKNPKKKISPMKRIFIVEMVKVAIVVIISGVIVFISSGRVIDSSKNIIASKNNEQTVQKKNESISTAQELFKKISGSQKKVEDALIFSEKIENLVLDMNKIATKHNLTFVTVFSPPTPGQGGVGGISLSRIDFTITTQGNVKNVNLFLKEFEKLPYFSDISGITINASTTTGWINESKITLSGKVLIRDDVATLIPAELK